MKEKYLDTYFFDSSLALKIALKKNKAETRNPNVKGLQICYYNGEKLPDAPRNCIHLPLEDIYSYFTTSNNRFPEFIAYNNSGFTENEQKTFNTSLHEILNLSISANHILVEKLKKKIKKNKPNFSDKQLRVFIPACRETVVMQHISKSIAKSFKDMGYNVKYCIQKSSMESCGALHSLKKLYKFNPHITVNINHLNNDYLHDDVFNVVWFQDPMESLKDKSQLHVRKKDYLLHLTQRVADMLAKKNVKSIYQPFSIDTSLYKNRKSILRENKIVFIGSSYKLTYDGITNHHKEELLEILKNEFFKNGIVPISFREALERRYNIDTTSLNHILNYITRDLALIHISNIDLNYKFEVYGYGWNEYPQLEKYYKGTLSYGKELSKVYNGAKYSLCIGGYVLQQRTLESAASGCIPLVLDSRKIAASKNELYFENSLLFFRKLDEIKDIIKKDKKVDLKYLVKRHTYKHLVKKITQLTNI